MVSSTAPEVRGTSNGLRPATALTWVVATVVIALLACAVPTAASSPEQPSAVAEADSAQTLREWHGGRKPDLTLTDIAGAKHSLADYGGRAVLVHFFATWCEPCRPEMQALERLAAREGNSAFRILAISVNEPDGRVRRFFEKTPVSFPVLLDRDRDIAKAWGVEILPTTYVLDAGLVPRLFVERDLEWDRLDIAPILKAGQQPIKPTSTPQGGN